MKKTLLAAAILAAFTAQAQAQSTVTISGRLDQSVARETSASGSAQKLNSETWTTSRLTFSGIEDMSNGLKAGFFLEGKVLADVGTTNLLDRESYVYLKGDFGTFAMGKIIGYASEVDAYTNTTEANQGKLSTDGNVADKTNNSVAYTTPTFSGFTGQLTYGFGETAGSSASNQYSAAARYTNGKLKASVAYGKKNSATAPITKLSQSVAGLSYDFGVVKLGGGYIVVNNTEATPNDKTKGYYLNAAIPFGAFNLIASYQKQKNDRGSAYDGHGYLVGGEYKLSKRTAMYMTYATATNKASGTFKVTGFAAAEVNRTNTLTSIGLRHSF